MSLAGKSLYVLTPCYGGNLSLNYHISFVKLVMLCRERNIEFGWSNTWNESLISRARNRMVDSFLKTSTSTHAIFIDADIGFEAEDVMAMLEMDKDIIGVPCSKKSIRWDRVQNAVSRRVLEWVRDNPSICQNGNDTNALLQQFKQSGREIDPAVFPNIAGDFVLNFHAFEGMKNLQMDQLEEMRSLGTGMLMIKREVFLKFMKAYPDRWYEARNDPASNPGRIHDFFKVGVNHETREYDSEDYWFCVPPGTKVYGDMLPIEQCSDANKVLSHTGVLQSVLSTIEREYNGSLIEIKPHHGAGFAVTPNHRLFVSRNGRLSFVRADEIQITDKLVVPMQKQKIFNRTFFFKAPIRSRFIQKQNGKFRFTRTHKDSQWFPLEIKITDELCSLLGYWLAEGSITTYGRQVEFDFCDDETEYVADVQRLLKTCFGLASSTRIDKRLLKVLCASTALADFLIQCCGKGAKNKKVPEAILSGKVSWIKSLLRSHWRGDGEKHFPYSICTASIDLVHCLRYMMLRCGIYPSLITRKNRAHDLYVTQDFYRQWAEIIGVPDYSSRLSYISGKHRGKWPKVSKENNRFLVGIRAIESKHYCGKVFNLKIAKDETYNLNGFSVHNCHDAIALGYKVLMWPCVRTTHMGTFTYVGDMPAALATTGEIF